MNEQTLNCNEGHRYFVRVKVPSGSVSVEPTTPGQVTGVKVAFSATRKGAAIHADVDNLTATEDASDPALFYYDLSQGLHQAHLLTLGRGKNFYAQWSKPGVTKFKVNTFRVATDTEI